MREEKGQGNDSFKFNHSFNPREELGNESPNTTEFKEPLLKINDFNIINGDKEEIKKSLSLF